MKLPKSLQQKLETRKTNNALRKLPVANNLVDFSSNDYLGFSKNEKIFNQTHQLLVDRKLTQNGATGSRLLSGNHILYQETEALISKFHQSESGLIFNSGYDANVGFFSCVPQRNDIIFFDELSHASIRDGIQMSLAKSYKFKHNDLADLEKLLQKNQSNEVEIYVVTESVFSMDGDSPNLVELVSLCEKYNALLIIDEAHALGVFGKNGEGIVQQLGLHNRVFARIMTFGKGLGCHGAAILGSNDLKEYLVNFARSFIYTTGLSPHSVATINVAYAFLETKSGEIEKLQRNIQFFKTEVSNQKLDKFFVQSDSAIHCAVIKGNTKVKQIAFDLQQKGFDVKPILSPTVPEGQERLRICLHSFNTEEEMIAIVKFLKELIA